MNDENFIPFEDNVNSVNFDLDMDIDSDFDVDEIWSGSDTELVSNLDTFVGNKDGGYVQAQSAISSTVQLSQSASTFYKSYIF